MRYLVLVLSLLLCPATALYARVTIGIGVELPGIDIGINLPAYPYLVRVPGYPVYYAPQVDVNLFFYDGLYWAYEDERWYEGSWYNGPWVEVEPEYVPLFILRIPVRYYRSPPAYFSDWRLDRPPRWEEYWGPGWARHHKGWDRWSLPAAPPAPLPNYQRYYSGNRYPGSVEQQYTIRSQSYRYQPREPVVQQHFQPRNQPPQERSRPPWQWQQVPQWQQQQAPQRQAPQWQQQQEPQWQQRQQQRKHQDRPRDEQHLQAPDTQRYPIQPQQKVQPKKRPPDIWPAETDQ